ncbi:hypothetical protein ACFFLS_11650 [Flavobacterium procerum]|uniref:Uncharacterized protein n=1 Tax=Flavobacterium procerum TaxID=1455569 RepID=A0ABV6BUK7_9FLAO
MALPDELYNVKFAEYFKLLKRMYVLDEKFKMICDAYCIIAADRGRYKDDSAKNYRLRIRSENLLKELEEEILFYIMRNG